MRCDIARLAISERMDHADPVAGGTSFDEIEAHLRSCPTCAEFEGISLRTRRALRFDAVALDDDLTAQVMQRVTTTEDIATKRSRGALAAVSLFVVCAVVAFAVTRWQDGVPPASADDRATLVARGQTLVRSLHARLALYERGADGAVTRHADGDLTYVAPEAVLLRLTTDGQSVEVGVNGESAWRRGSSESTVRGREPFDRSGWSALELVVPVDAFGRDGAGTVETALDGRTARLVSTTVAQVDELLAALRSGTEWRPLHPSDVVTLWLDAASAVPLRVEVHASADPDRVAWSARHGFEEPGDGAIFVAALSDLQINEPTGATVSAPVGDESSDLGFVDRTVGLAELPVPGWLPDGMVEYRSGERRAPGADRPVVVRTWTNGRSWVKVTGTQSWDGNQLFGYLGALVRPVQTAAGVVYASEDAASIALHGDDVDLVVTGSVGEADLIRIATSLGVVGQLVPEWWVEAGSTTVEELTQGDRPALVPPAGADLGGASVAIASRSGRVDIAIAGPGARGARIVEITGLGTTPSEDPDARAVIVRGIEGRYSPGLGELSWVERDRLIVLSSDTLTHTEMVDLAAQLRWTR